MYEDGGPEVDARHLEKSRQSARRASVEMVNVEIAAEHETMGGALHDAGTELSDSEDSDDPLAFQGTENGTGRLDGHTHRSPIAVARKNGRSESSEDHLAGN